MADQSQGKGSATAPKSSSDHPSQQQQHPLSCTHCRQRKIKCDKVHPCSPCQRSNIQCIFPERARHSKKKRSTPKATNDELIRRLGRMEELIEKMKVEGTSPLINTIEDPRRSNSPRSPQITRRTSEESRSQESVGTENAGDGATTFMGSGFFRSLTNEVLHVLPSSNALGLQQQADVLIHFSSMVSNKQWTRSQMRKTLQSLLNHPLIRSPLMPRCSLARVPCHNKSCACSTPLQSQCLYSAISMLLTAIQCSRSFIYQHCKSSLPEPLLILRIFRPGITLRRCFLQRTMPQ